MLVVASACSYRSNLLRCMVASSPRAAKKAKVPSFLSTSRLMLLRLHHLLNGLPSFPMPPRSRDDRHHPEQHHMSKAVSWHQEAMIISSTSPVFPQASSRLNLILDPRARTHFLPRRLRCQHQISLQHNRRLDRLQAFSPIAISRKGHQARRFASPPHLPRALRLQADFQRGLHPLPRRVPSPS